MENKSTLTFNCSVQNKENLKVIKDPFQILPSTVRHLSENTIKSYPKVDNPNLLIHMNYITRVYNDNAIENRSIERFSLKSYKLLADILNTKDILIHLPYTEKEIVNLEYGIKIIKDELLNKNINVHFEIPAWSKGMFIKNRINQHSASPYCYMALTKHIDEVFSLLKDTNSYLVPDTAHLHSNGLDAKDMIELIKKYDDKIKYIHLNGNSVTRFKMDNHTPMFSVNNRIVNHELLSSEVAKMGKICIAEITKETSDWKSWVNYTQKYNFKLVDFNEYYTI